MTLAGPIAAIERLAARVLGSRASESFRFVLLSGSEGRDAFELDEEGGQVIVRGSSGPALATGLNWYLTQYAGTHVSWQGTYSGHWEKPPRLSGPIRRESWAQWRYFLNYCCYSYSLPFWKWEQWEPFIDWMALHGINMPLALTGQEAVWARVCRKLGLSDSETHAFLPGAAYLPFGWMGCLDGWTGPLSDHWIGDHEALGRRILERQRELGMTPVMPGFTGHVPAALRRLNPGAKFQNIRWFEWETTLLDPLDPLFQEMAVLYWEEQTAIFGTDHYYAADTFIEMIPPSGDAGYLAELGSALYQGMAQCDTKAVWVLQGWPFNYHKEFWTQARLHALLDAVPSEHMLLLDLFCEVEPMWQKSDGFCGKPWLWCNIQNFGATEVLTGALETNNSGLQEARRHPLARHLAGLGMVNEGLCHNPAAYDFLFERAWCEQPVDLAAWGRRYAVLRYGADQPAAKEAWEILTTTAYSTFRHEESGLVKCPTLPAQVAPHALTSALLRTWELLLSAAPDLGGRETWRFDMVHVGRQVLSNLGGRLKKDLQDSVAGRNTKEFARIADAIRELLLDLEILLSTQSEFCLDPWIRAAESWGRDDLERIALRQGALRQITLWGDGEQMLRDYARKEWAGLISAYYLPRWEAWFAFVAEALRHGLPPDEKRFREESVEWERNWICEVVFSELSIGDVLVVSRRLYEKYRSADFSS